MNGHEIENEKSMSQSMQAHPKSTWVKLQWKLSCNYCGALGLYDPEGPKF